MSPELSQQTNPTLEHDERREATGPLRGYGYQIVHSVLAWLKLRPGETLYLEAAEDFDRIGDDRADLTQVKDTAGSGNITLRNSGVLDALGHYWDHRTRNPDRQITFRYLTTSEVGIEKDDPIGQGVGGLALWQRATGELSPTERQAIVEKLRAYLVTDPHLPADLRTWIREASLDQVFDQLVRPITWETGASSAADVLAVIRGYLVEHGEQRGVPAQDAEQVADSLFYHAWITATREKSRALDRASFLSLFDSITRTSIPTGQLASLLNCALGISGPISSLRTSLGPVFKLRALPPSPAELYIRQGIRDALTQSIQKDGIAVLHGSTGIGKTTVAASFAKEQSGTWGWVDLRGQDTPAVVARLDAVLETVSNAHSATSIIIDDIDFSGDFRSSEELLARLAEVQRTKSAALIITTAQELLPRVRANIGCLDTSIHRVPRYSRQEIQEILAAHGCDDPARRDQWAVAIEISTSGHPQLVHARVIALALRQFPPLSADDLLRVAPEVLDAQTEARALLAHIDAAPRALLYRLSVVAGIFDRDLAISIASAPPPVAEPGTAFDLLIGPWIETIAPDRYRVSPLARSSGEAVHGSAWTREVHSIIATALLSRTVLTTTDISTILMHGVLAGEASALGRLSVGLLRADDATWGSIAEAAPWFTAVGVPDGTRIEGASESALFAIRYMQYRMASASDPSGARAILRRFNAEFPRNTADMRGRLSRMLFIAQVLMRTEISYSGAELVDMAAEFVSIARAADELVGSVTQVNRDSEYAERMKGPTGKFEFALSPGLMLIPRLQGTEALDETIGSLEAREASVAQTLLWGLGNNEWLARALLDGIWLRESKLPKPDWQRLRATVVRLYKLARRLDVPQFSAAAARVAIRMTDEEVGSADEAAALARRCLGEIGNIPSVEDALARVLARSGDDDGALAIWREGLPKWMADPNDLAPSYSYRDAAMAAERHALWEEAAEFLQSAIDRADSTATPAYVIGLMFDRGYALWEGGRPVEAKKLLWEAVDRLDAHQISLAENPFYSLLERAYHVMSWIVAITTKHAAGELQKPALACCSSLDPLPEKYDRHTPVDFLIEKLLVFEEQAIGDDELFSRYHRRLRVTPYGVVRSAHATLATRHALRTLQLDDMVSLACDQVEALVAARKFYKEAGNDDTTPMPELATSVITTENIVLLVLSLLFSTFALAARGKLERLPIQQWTLAARERGVEGLLASFLDAYRQIVIDKSVPSREVMMSGAWAEQTLASLTSAISDDIPPEQMIQCHALWCRNFRQIQIRDWIGDDVCSLVITGWQRMIQAPHSLVSPRTSIPAIRAAIESHKTGWAKARQILLAAFDAVPAAYARGVRADIEGLPE